MTKELLVEVNKFKKDDKSVEIKIPNKWLEKLFITELDNEIKIILEKDKILIKKFFKEIDDNYKGKAILCIREKNYPVDIVFQKVEKNGYSLYAESRESILDSNISLKYNDMMNPILKNIEVENAEGEKFTGEFLKHIFIQSIQDENKKFEIGSITKEFKLKPKLELKHHFVYYDNFVMKCRFYFQYKEIVIQRMLHLNNESKISISKKSNIDINELENIILLLELIQGQRLIKFFEKKKDEIILYGRHINAPSIACNSILSNYNYVDIVVKGILNFLDSQKIEEKNKWIRALELLKFYEISQNVEFLTKLFQFINIFKGAKKDSYKDILLKEFKVESNEEADFTTKIRNDVIHEGLFLNEAINKNMDKLNKNNRILKENIQKNMDLSPFIYSLYVEKLVIDFIERKIFPVKYRVSEHILDGLFDDFILKKDSKIFKNFDYINNQYFELNNNKKS